MGRRKGLTLLHVEVALTLRRKFMHDFHTTQREMSVPRKGSLDAEKATSPARFQMLPQSTTTDGESYVHKPLVSIPYSMIRQNGTALSDSLRE